jgi:hypothetical protein
MHLIPIAAAACSSTVDCAVVVGVSMDITKLFVDASLMHLVIDARAQCRLADECDE